MKSLKYPRRQVVLLGEVSATIHLCVSTKALKHPVKNAKLNARVAPSFVIVRLHLSACPGLGGGLGWGGGDTSLQTSENLRLVQGVGG